MARRGDVTRVGKFTLFFAKCTFSQHTRRVLIVDDLSFHSALHYMLYEKASEYSLWIGKYNIYESVCRKLQVENGI